ncbi:uncharacterized protein ATNIH1004_011059 [Aspergillus tanneri]|uniref:Protein BIG1 n=1 Tax=Aspergillus tanneri TaxID=1220188 RepID=A0A5M9M5P8_9EURO|nr:uncharacterized protein ATNIH1004_011059 [Aspergillus tanneri]KAA8642118.1 hypothetical protein ATNIH1004_011059 [Aspergillus tanneri]
MHLSCFTLLAVGAATVNAFRDTSPFFLASTSEITLPSEQLKTATSLLEELTLKFSTCPSDYYVIVSQPGVHSTDFATLRSAPRLGAKMTGQDKGIRSTMTVHEVAGVLEAKQIQNLLERDCGAQTTVVDGASGSYPSDFGAAPHVIYIDFPVLPLGTERSQQLSDNDGLISDIIERLPAKKEYSVLYTTSPKEFVGSDSSVYQPKGDLYQDTIHMDLKRDYSAQPRQDNTPSNNKSLFQEYQYFTPGMLPLDPPRFRPRQFALTSLEVPYAAFEKDTASSVQKKQQ